MKEMHQDPHEEKIKQLETLHRLATRLPWIVLGISILAFLIILLQALWTRS